MEYGAEHVCARETSLFPTRRYIHYVSRLLLVLIAKVVHFQARQARVDQQECRDLQIPPDHRGVQSRPATETSQRNVPEFSGDTATKVLPTDQEEERTADLSRHNQTVKVEYR